MDLLKFKSFDFSAVSNPLLTVLPVLFVLLLGLGLMLAYYSLRWWAEPTTEYKQLSGHIEKAELRAGGGGRSNRVPNIKFAVRGEAFYARSACAKKLLDAQIPLDRHEVKFKVSANGYHFYADGNEPYLVSEMAIDGVSVCTFAEAMQEDRDNRRRILALSMLVLAGAAFGFFKWQQLSRRAKQALYAHYPKLE